VAYGDPTSPFSSVERADRLLTELFSTPGHPDPYPRYRELRELAPVHAYAGGYVAVTYEACDAALRNPAMSCGSGFTLEHLATPMWRSAARWIMYQDGDQHRRVRGLLTSAFTPRSVEALRPYVADLVDGYLDDLSGAEEFELVSALAFPLPITVIGELIGIPEPDRHRFRDWSRLILAVVANAQPTPEEMDEANAATVESEDYLRDLVTERRRDPRDDLATRLAFAELDGDQLTDDEIVSNLNVLVGAGFETTVFMLGSSVNALLDHPDQLRVLLDRPDAVKQAIEELLRFEAPVLSPNPRVATVDTVVAGHPIPAGDRIVVLPGAANRDPAHVDDPDRLDLLRANPRPLTFGAGFHFCVGAALARMEIQEALARLFARFPRLEQTQEEVDWAPSFLFRGPRTLPLRVG
jgi:cytochrome P450